MGVLTGVKSGLGARSPACTACVANANEDSMIDPSAAIYP